MTIKEFKRKNKQTKEQQLRKIQRMINKHAKRPFEIDYSSLEYIFGEASEGQIMEKQGNVTLWERHYELLDRVSNPSKTGHIYEVTFYELEEENDGDFNLLGRYVL